jgi:hypothetical protein
MNEEAAQRENDCEVSSDAADNDSIQPSKLRSWLSVIVDIIGELL